MKSINMLVFVTDTVNIICAAGTEYWIITELARFRYASARSFARPTRSRFSVVSLSTRVNSELVPKIHVVFHAFHPALPKVITVSI